MAYVLSQSQMSLVRCPRDVECFENSWFKRVQRAMDAFEAPQRTEQHVDERGRKFTITLHAVTGNVLGVAS